MSLFSIKKPGCKQNNNKTREEKKREKKEKEDTLLTSHIVRRPAPEFKVHV